MSNDSPAKPPTRLALFRNWLSWCGMAVMAASLFSFFLLLFIHVLAPTSNPYVGILNFIVAPAFLILGIGLTLLGAFLRHRQVIKAHGAPLPMTINLSRPRDRRIFAYFLTGGVLFLLLSALGSYKTYHFTESVQFCGGACHTVMRPELVTYQHSPHARVACTECHIGPGATWFVRSKLSGTYQVYATLADKYPRPIPTPIKHLRPAQDTCEQCHWPRKFVGNLDRTFSHFLTDQTNTEYSVRLLLKVGGGDPTSGPVGGIHWHMNVGNKVEYFPRDKARQDIPWVRLTDAQGVVTVFRVEDFTNQVAESEIRTVDCMDCHNRPAHIYKSPNDAVNLAMSLGNIDPSIPLVKSNAMYVLTQTYTNETDALQKIATSLASSYPNSPQARKVISAVQTIYSENFFPEMKANWKAYPDNIGHKMWPGCFRCHDGKHVSDGGKEMIKSGDCNACHIILTQGRGEELNHLSAEGQEFKHPSDAYDPDFLCSDCHTGGL